MKRLFDLLVSLLIFIVFLPIFVLLCIAIVSTSKGSPFHCSKRIGKDDRLFIMWKFRTMHLNTPQVATHLVDDPSLYLIPLGRFLRKFSLDELPQLLNVIKGDMSIVGPRPSLFNQDDQIKLRMELGVNKLLPGITGWAQVNGRDEISIQKKVAYDKWYLDNYSFSLDLRIIYLTFIQVIKKKNVIH